MHRSQVLVIVGVRSSIEFTQPQEMHSITYMNHPGEALPDEAGDGVLVPWRLGDL